jgi:hypothetical protein
MASAATVDPARFKFGKLLTSARDTETRLSAPLRRLLRDGLPRNRSGLYRHRLEAAS